MAGKCVNTSRGANTNNIVVGGAGVPILRLPFLLLTLLLLSPCVLGRGTCPTVNCNKVCRKDSSLYEPQVCHECCSGWTSSSGDNLTDSERLEHLETKVEEWKLLAGVAMGLAVLCLVINLVMCLVFLSHLQRHHHTTFTLPFFLGGVGAAERAKAKEAHEMEASKTPVDMTAGRIANYQNKHSPLNGRVTTQSTVNMRCTEDRQVTNSTPQRVRQPSECSSPDDSRNLTPIPSPLTSPDDSHHHPHAYHNLAISTSTLHHNPTVSSSSSTLTAAVSTNTLDTTLASGPGTNPHSSPNMPTRI